MTNGTPASIRLEITLPCDPRFRSMVGQVVDRLVAAVGGPADAASDVTAAMREATTGVLARAGDAACRSLAVSLIRDGSALTVRVRYVGARGGGAVARILADRADDAPVPAMRRAVGRVEVADVDGAACCTLVVPFPVGTP